jgi:hypothetical protein
MSLLFTCCRRVPCTDLRALIVLSCVRSAAATAQPGAAVCVKPYEVTP